MPNNIPELFGSMVFNDDVMRERLPEGVYKSLSKTPSRRRLQIALQNRCLPQAH